MNRKEIKKEARKNLKNHYFQNLIVVFICGLLLTGGFNFTTKNILNTNINDKETLEILTNKNLSNSEIIDEILNKTEEDKKIEEKIGKKYTGGVLSTFVNEITSSGSFLFGIINGINKTIFNENVGVLVVLIISSIIICLAKIFIINPIQIGENRYFLEHRRYLNTKMDRITFPYKNKKTRHVAVTLLIKDIYEVLWWFTIVGGFIKHYEYSMIPYILAENPEISRKEAFKISKELTYGNKINLFKIDLSLIGWSILSAFTFNLSKIFFSDIYIQTIYAETYMNLRNKKQIPSLNDKLLNINKQVNEEYPEERKEKTREWLKKLDYDKNYSITSYILFFFTFALVGWLWEVLLHISSSGEFINRGTLHGPWLPIYGFGGVLILFCLKKFRKNPFSLFISAFVLCGIVEYGTAWYLETFKAMKYWDYSGYFLNLHGRICLEGLLVFGLGGCAFTYIVAPVLDNLYKKIKPEIKGILCMTLLIIFTLDFMYSSLIKPNTGKGISEPVSHIERKIYEIL